MTLVAAAVCPHPPLLVPALTGAALAPDEAGELDALRTACRAAVDRVAAASPTLFVVGADAGPRATTLAPWGVEVAVAVPEPLPLSLLVGGWLLGGQVASYVVVDPSLDAKECADLGAELAAAAERVALLVMGDGAVRASERAPSASDAEAADFDGAVERALAAADPAALLALDADAATALQVAGRAPWQLLAGAAGGDRFCGRVTWSGSPYGVGYLVAEWTAP